MEETRVVDPEDLPEVVSDFQAKGAIKIVAKVKKNLTWLVIGTFPGQPAPDPEEDFGDVAQVENDGDEGFEGLDLPEQTERNISPEGGGTIDW